ncbi:MAG TPA: ABC transporter [Flavobacteriales bacterium]|nr:ABC transporter [Flavobacteriales bacterium]
MSEEVLKALMQLFAIIIKQDEGLTKGERDYVQIFLKQQLASEDVVEYLNLFDEFAGESDKKADSDDTHKRTSVIDSVRTLGICKRINKKLTQEQKVIVLVRLFELVKQDRKFTANRMSIINTAADVFNISKEEHKSIEDFVVTDDPAKLSDAQMLVIAKDDLSEERTKFIRSELDTGYLVILKVASVNLYFLRYSGTSDIYLNGLGLINQRIYLFASGGTLRLPKGLPVLYSDVVGCFMRDSSAAKLSFDIENLEYRFPNGNIGLRNINLSEGEGKLIGIMGASGAGKTTLLNTLAGLEQPYQGKVLINGIDLHREKQKLEGVIGYIPQDDLLIEELTIYQNLYYCSKLIFKDLSEAEIEAKVHKVLKDLGLFERKDLKVGSPMDKIISGGQRKRLNIALELIREPAILFVDEPTSGLSSRDSENVMDLLRDLTHKGKLIFVVIHQPSSDIYKMFDKLVILDVHGYMVYYGNPVEAVMYFKRIDHQISSGIGECITCGNVNPELIFNIIEARVVDEFGNFTDQRRVQPEEWETYFKEEVVLEKAESSHEPPPSDLNIPSVFSQFVIFLKRDFLSKVNNLQYIVLNLLEAPALAFILAFIIRYTDNPEGGNYLFRYNDNIPPYIFMSIIVSLFLGLTVSAEEIFRDRKILKRESFLNLSRGSYLFSKIGILFSLSAIQSFLFVIVGNGILEIHGMHFAYWFALFTVSCFANILGLNISATFNAAVTIYILIPLLIIPQMVLGGAMFSFEKLNKLVGGGHQVPLIADVMAARWAYEALTVEQFKNNAFQKQTYDIERMESMIDYKQVYYIPKLEEILEEALFLEGGQTDSIQEIFARDVQVLKNEIMAESKRISEVEFPYELTTSNFDITMFQNLEEYLVSLKEYYKKVFNKVNRKKEGLVNEWQNSPEKRKMYVQLRDHSQNEYLTDIVKNVYTENKIAVMDHRLIQIIDPVFNIPQMSGPLNYRAHFYAPKKTMFGTYHDTFIFNMGVIWFFSLILYITLYFESLKKLLSLNLNIKRSKSK